MGRGRGRFGMGRGRGRFGMGRGRLRISRGRSTLGRGKLRMGSGMFGWMREGTVGLIGETTHDKWCKKCRHSSMSLLMDCLSYIKSVDTQACLC